MAESEPRYVLTFEPGTPEMVAVSVVAVAGAGAVVFLSFAIRSFVCGEASGDCSGSTALLVIACAGVAPTLAMVLESARRRGHPWYWFFAAMLVYGFWAVVALSVWS